MKHIIGNKKKVINKNNKLKEKNRNSKNMYKRNCVNVDVRWGPHKHGIIP